MTPLSIGYTEDTADSDCRCHCSAMGLHMDQDAGSFFRCGIICLLYVLYRPDDIEARDARECVRLAIKLISHCCTLGTLREYFRTAGLRNETNIEPPSSLYGR